MSEPKAGLAILDRPSGAAGLFPAKLAQPVSWTPRKYDWIASSLFSPLAVQRDEHVVHVQVTDAQSKDLRDAAAGIEQQQREQMQPPLVEMSWHGLPIHKARDLIRCQRGQDVLWFFQLLNA